MKNEPFQAALKALIRYIDSKRTQDEIAVLAIRDTTEGYEVVTAFERDKEALVRRIADVKPDGDKTRLYDSIGAAMQMCAMASQGAVRPTPENYIISCGIVIFSDGHDENSALSREELNARITSLSIPIPIYSIAYGQKREPKGKKSEPDYFKNLEAISKNSFGIYYLIDDAYPRMTSVVEDIQYIMKNDYVVTFRSYICIDGEEHIFKLGVEYPSDSGKYFYESKRFEAIKSPIPPIPNIKENIDKLHNQLSYTKEGPYIKDKDIPILITCNDQFQCCKIEPPIK